MTRFRLPYQVALGEAGDLQWILDLPEGKKTFDKEPDSTWTKRFLANLLSWIPVGNQL